MSVPALYDRRGVYARGRLLPAAVAWSLGAVVFFAAETQGGTLPALAVSGLAYRALATRAR